jgi:toxin FitB
VYLLDTNVVSELRKVRAGRADARVAAWAESVDPADLYLSVVSLQELEIGVLLKERSDPAQGAALRRWLDGQVVSAFAARTLPVDAVVALRSAALHVPDPRPVRDGLIAGTALVHGLRVVTRNVTDFEPMGVDVLDPWRTG